MLRLIVLQAGSMIYIQISINEVTGDQSSTGD